MVSRYRPDSDIIACTTDESIGRQLNLSWGVTPIVIKEENDTFELFSHAVESAKEKGYLEKGDITVVTAGVPLGTSGTTNMLKVEVVE